MLGYFTMLCWSAPRRWATGSTLAPGALIFGLIVSMARPVSHDVLSRSLQDSAEQYGSIGVAFTYIAFLYALSLVFLASAFLGQVIATDEGRLGRWIRRAPEGG